MCGEPAAAKQETGASEQCAVPHARAFCRVCAVLCAVVVRAWAGAAVVRCAGGLLPRSLAGAAAERHRAVASSTRFLSSYIHILCTRGCSILVDQTSNTRGHLRPPPSWWCVRPCAFVSSRLLLTNSLSAALRFPIPSFSVCEHNNGVPVRPSRPIPYPKDTRLRFTS